MALRHLIGPNLAALILALPTIASAAPDDAPAGAPVVPPTRAALRQALEESKKNQPRLPLPPLTAEEEEKAAKGDWSVVNNGRMRRHYLSPTRAGGGFGRLPLRTGATNTPAGNNNSPQSRQADPAMSLGYPFQTMIFWIVSRQNNCTYCMGHQESKLAAAGVPDDRIAALDSDWSSFTPAERAAFTFASKLNTTPHEVTDADVEALRPFYNDAQILEIVTVTGNFAAMNRWTGALRIPQEDHREYLSEVAKDYDQRASLVAPVDPAAATGASCAPPAKRPALELRQAVEEQLEATRVRKPRVPLIAEDEARKALPATVKVAADAPLPAYVRLLARFPLVGSGRIALHQAAQTDGELPARYRALIAWTAARNDRAWYALGHARLALREQGLSDDQIFALDAPATDRPAADQAVLDFARKITIDPARIGDADIASLRAHFPDRQVAEIVDLTTEAAFFDRVTEAAALPLEADPAPAVR